MDKHQAKLTKITFPVDPKATSGPVTETLWAEVLGGGRYRLDNSPFYVYGVSYGDVVSAKGKDGLLFTDVAERGGHSTYRIFLSERMKNQKARKQLLKPLNSLGCTYEGTGGRLVTIDVPPQADIDKVYDLLEKGEAEKIWEFEEAHHGHLLRVQKDKS